MIAIDSRDLHPQAPAVVKQPANAGVSTVLHVVPQSHAVRVQHYH